MVMLDLLVLGRRVLIGVEASRGPTPQDGNFSSIFSSGGTLKTLRNAANWVVNSWSCVF